MTAVSCVGVVILSVLLSACGGGGGDGGSGNVAPPPVVPATGFVTVARSEWTVTSVRKVLRAFAYGGSASEQQIALWASMLPEDAISEMLTFAPVNDRLSPVEDATSTTDGTLLGLQTFWSSSDVSNPVRPDRRAIFNYLEIGSDGRRLASVRGLQQTWAQAGTTRGLNPFRQKVGMYLTNYLMAVDVEYIRPALMRAFYDDLMNSLARGDDFESVMAFAAQSGTIATQYGHSGNIYGQSSGLFSGNDDFAREFHQLFFGIQGDLEDQDYHENTTIENTAWVLTGMGLDRTQSLYGSQKPIDWWDPHIVFTDHQTLGSYRYNYSNHYHGCLEVLHQSICGMTADEKIRNLAAVAMRNTESMENLPVNIISYFGDDNLDAGKIRVIREEWARSVRKDLLEFLQRYAISTTFHRADAVKYIGSFDRNLIAVNLNTLDNVENFALGNTPLQQMQAEGVNVFSPEHNVFGGQTGPEASVNEGVFKEAYAHNVERPQDLAETRKLDYPDSQGNPVSWYKDWARVAPAEPGGGYSVARVGAWLWERFIGDGGKNYGPLEQAHVEALLASGMDLNSAAAGSSVLLLDSLDPAEREEANRRVGLAVNFITLTPYMFAQEGK